MRPRSRRLTHTTTGERTMGWIGPRLSRGGCDGGARLKVLRRHPADRLGSGLACPLAASQPRAAAPKGPPFRWASPHSDSRAAGLTRPLSRRSKTLLMSDSGIAISGSVCCERSSAISPWALPSAAGRRAGSTSRMLPHTVMAPSTRCALPSVDRLLRPSCGACSGTRGPGDGDDLRPAGEECQWNWLELPDTPWGSRTG